MTNVYFQFWWENPFLLTLSDSFPLDQFYVPEVVGVEEVTDDDDEAIELR